MMLESLTLTLSAGEVRRAFLSARMPQGMIAHDVRLGHQTMDFYVRLNKTLPVPARIRVEVLSFSGHKVRIRVLYPRTVTWSSHPGDDAVWNMPGLQETGDNTAELDLVALARGHLEGLNLVGLRIDPQGITVAASDIKLRADWNEILTL